MQTAGFTHFPTILAFEALSREDFVPAPLRDFAYDDTALQIGYGQTISQPLLLLSMIGGLDITQRHKVLDDGTGSGYSSAILSKIAKEVVSTEVVPELAEQAESRIQRLGLENVSVKKSRKRYYGLYFWRTL